MKGFLLKIFKELKVEPERYRVIINLPRRVDDACKKNILGVLFNTFQVVKSCRLLYFLFAEYFMQSILAMVFYVTGKKCSPLPSECRLVLGVLGGQRDHLRHRGTV